MLGIVLRQSRRIAHGLLQTVGDDFHCHLYCIGFRVSKGLGQQSQLADLIGTHAPVDAMLAILLNRYGLTGRIQQLRSV